MNLLVEDWGGKQSWYLCKSRNRCKDIIRKVLLEVKFSDLKANPNKAAWRNLLKPFR
jgi:hypothetical protein